MNIEQFEPWLTIANKTPLGKFLDFCKSIENMSNVTIEKEDWDNMCGIIIKQKWVDGTGDQICLNFWKDGSFRTIIGK